ncbi:MAG TPA: glycosyltransferase family 4 protein [Actinomycetes bacterium]|nr:glycosyltransferase family 4 protein [Actinomycetes bacterium]
MLKDVIAPGDVRVAPTRYTPARSPLRIALVAPPWFELPPKGYGGIEAMLFWLVQGLVARGHDVTLIGAGEDHTGARFLPTYAEPPTAKLGQSFPEVIHALTATEYLDELEVDVLHDHTLAGPLLLRGTRIPAIVTSHGPITGELAEYYRMINRYARLVAISEFQRTRAPHLQWAGMVHNAIPVAEYPFQAKKEEFVLFLGRMSAEKSPDLAIKAARAAGREIVVAAKCNEPAEHEYFEQRVRPLLGPDAHWFGEADSKQKKELLAQAHCLVFPIQWDEPFGIVMVEAMACGTPVVALRRGSVPEVVRDGLTGWIRDDPAKLPAAIERAGELDPWRCRSWVADNFDVSGMVSGYEAIFRRALLALPVGGLTPQAGLTESPGQAPAGRVRRSLKVQRA